LRFRPADAAKSADKSRSADKPQEGRPEGRKDERSKADAAQMGTVYVLENGQAKAIRIAAGITDNRNTEVISGDLKEGTVVILEDRQASAKKSTNSAPRLF